VSRNVEFGHADSQGVGLVTSNQKTTEEQASDSERPLRGLLVGCGYISTQQLDAWAQISEAEIVVLVDMDEDKARSQADAYGIDATHTDLAAALEQHDVDFVDIATQPPTHLDLVRICAAAGVHILCQKPFAPTLAEIDEMVGIADRAGVQLVANENMRFQPWFLKMKQLLDSGAIGRPFYAHWANKSRGTLPAVTFAGQPYFAIMPRLVIYEMGIHFLDTMRYLFGEPQRLSATIGNASSEIAGEDNAVALVSYENMVAIMDISWASIPTYSKADAVSWAVMTIEGEGGTMHLSPDGRLRVITDESEEVIEFGPNPIADSFVGMQRRFIECLTSDFDCEMSGREYTKTMELVFGAYASATNHEMYHIGQDRHLLS